MGRGVEKISHEFYCSKSRGGCEKYFDLWLRSDFYGNFTIRCPACNHDHFRLIEDGVLTSIFHTKQLDNVTILVSMASTVRDEPRITTPEEIRSQLKLVSGGLCDYPEN